MPPAKSQAQARWAQKAYERGELTKDQRDEFVKGVRVSRLPARLHPKKRKRPKQPIRARAARRAAAKLRAQRKGS